MAEFTEVPQTTSNLTEHQRNAIALMAVSGLPTSHIASAVGRSVANIRKVIKDDPDVRARMNIYEGRVIRALSVHKFEMLDKLEVARKNIMEGLNAPDLKTKLDTSWKVLDHAVPKEAQRVEVEMNAESRTELANATVDLQKSMEELRAAMNGKHALSERVGDTLPGPISQIPERASEGS